MTMAPFFTIAIPTYNRGRILGKAISAALAQTERNFELLISDNGSSDNTQQVVKSFEDQRIVAVKHLENKGAFFNFHYCMNVAKGKYLIFLADDDSLGQEFLRQTLQVVSAHKDIGLVYSGRKCVDASSGRESFVAEGNGVFYPDLASWLSREREKTIMNISGVALNLSYLRNYLPFNDWGAGWGMDDYIYMLMVAHGGAFGFKDIAVSMSVAVQDNNVCNTEPALVLASCRETSQKMLDLIDVHVPVNQRDELKSIILQRYNDSVFVPRFLVKQLVRRDGSLAELLRDFERHQISLWSLFQSLKVAAATVVLLLPRPVRSWFLNRFTKLRVYYGGLAA